MKIKLLYLLLILQLSTLKLLSQSRDTYPRSLAAFGSSPSGLSCTTYPTNSIAIYNGTIYYCNSTWQPIIGSNAGTVTSVALTAPSIFAVSGSPITTSGTFGLTFASAQTSHQVLGTCGSSTTFGPCSLVSGDLPTISMGGDISGSTGSATVIKLNGGSIPTSSNVLASNGSSQLINATYANLVTLWASGSCSGFLKNDGTCSIPSGGGTVTSVGLTAPAIFTVSGSPVTGTGSLSFSLNTQSPNLVWAGPTSGGAATPTFRALVVADIPTGLNQNTTGNAATATNLSSYPSLCTGGQFSQGLSSGSNNCGTPSGGGGVGYASQLSDFSPVRTSNTVVTLASPSGGTNFGNNNYAANASTTATITLAASSSPAGSIYYAYWSPTSGVQVATSSGVTQANVTLTGASFGSSTATGFPANVIRLAVCLAGDQTADQWDTNACTNWRSVFTMSQYVAAASGNLIVTGPDTHGITSLALDPSQPIALSTTMQVGNSASCSTNLATSPANGTTIYGTDCKNVVDDTATAGAVCITGGHGALMRRENGSWRCN